MELMLGVEGCCQEFSEPDVLETAKLAYIHEDKFIMHHAMPRLVPYRKLSNNILL